MRHGEVVNGGEKRYNGHIDIDITETGVHQMHRLAERLDGKSVAAVYSSDLIRSRKGAEIISQRLNLNGSMASFSGMNYYSVNPNGTGTLSVFG